MGWIFCRERLLTCRSHRPTEAHKMTLYSCRACDRLAKKGSGLTSCRRKDSRSKHTVKQFVWDNVNESDAMQKECVCGSKRCIQMTKRVGIIFIRDQPSYWVTTATAEAPFIDHTRYWRWRSTADLPLFRVLWTSFIVLHRIVALEMRNYLRELCSL